MLVFCEVQDAIEGFRNGEFIIVMDDESRENEGDLIIAAEHMSQDKMAFLVRYSSGFVCVPLSEEKADNLCLSTMVPNNSDKHGTAYTVTCDYRHGSTTGISARDRAMTVRKLADASSTASDFDRPGHICPLRAVPGLLKQRRGHTEAGVQLCQLAGLQPASAICELVRDEDGLMMRLDDCVKFAKEHNLKVTTIEKIAEYVCK